MESDSRFKESIQTFSDVHIHSDKLIRIKEGVLRRFPLFDFRFFNTCLLQAGLFQWHIIIGVKIIIDADNQVSFTQ